MGVARDFDGSRVLLTGGGSGIGRALAVRLATRGARLVLVGRREEQLRSAAQSVEAQGATVTCLAADLTMTGQPERAVDEAVAAMGGLDVLVNNAGNVSAGNLDEIAIDDIVAMVQLNLVAPILLTRAALPALRESGRRGGALVVGVSSGIALVGMPYYATYAATKAGLSRFDEALRRELIGTGVSVATVYPGATETPMMATSHAGPDLGFQRRPVSDVVDDIVMALEAGKVEIDTSQGADRHARQELNKRDPEAVDAELAPKLAALHEATRTHRSM